MTIRWASLATPDDRARRARLVEAARAYWEALLRGEVPNDEKRLLRLPRCADELEIERWRDELILRPLARDALPLAELFRDVHPEPARLLLGRPKCGHEGALALLEAKGGASLEGARVRVGVTRGHLLEVTIGIPLDVPGDEESLQWMAELYLEAALGESALDEWVACVDVVRTQARRSLGVLAPKGNRESVTYPLAMTVELFERATAGISANRLDRSALSTRGWTALELSQTRDAAFQPERLFASTCLPELYKATFEGLPVSVGRFLEPHLTILSFAVERGVSSLREGCPARASFEAALAESSRFPSGAPSIVGGGFGPKHDYLELALEPTEESLARCLALGRELGLRGELLFFESTLRQERLPLPANE